MKIKFIGATREVTGSKHLIVTKEGKQILLDCGMFQGKGMETDKSNRHLSFNPKIIDHIVLTHAHIDHSGLIPYYYKLGFRGTIVCTNATRDLCANMLADAGHIQEHDTLTFNKKRAKQNLPPVEPLFTKADAIDCMSLFIGVPHNLKFRIDQHIKVKFTHTGHMLGSAVANLELDEGNRKIKLAYTGDIGRPFSRILRSPDAFPQADIIIMESTYGNRLHHDNDKADNELLRVVEDTCVTKRGKLIIPSFSVGRTQEIVYTLNNLYNEGKLPRIEVFVDSPLAFNVTDVYRLHPECFNKKMLQSMEIDPDPFGFKSLTYVRSITESKRLNDYDKPCIIISASGMMEAGRVKHHLANSISNPRNTVLVVGYCAPTTLGAKIMRGDKKVSIHGHVYDVRADVRIIESYSGHADYQEMIHFLRCQKPDELKQIYLVHGNLEAMDFFSEQLHESGFKHVKIPDVAEEVEY